jgi:hypothetical protein
LVDTKGATQTVTSQAAYIQPAGWSPDGKEIVYRTGTDRQTDAANGPAQQIQEVWTVALGDNGLLGEAKLRGEVNFGQGCGGGGRSESANVYERQSGFAYGYMSAITDWTAGGILLYSDNCSTRGVSRFDLNDNRPLGPYPGNLRSLSLNANADKWVAIDGDNHLVTGAPEITPTVIISTSAAPELVVYGQKTATIYYTTLVVSDSVDLTEQAAGTLDPSIQVYPYFDYTVDGLVALNPATGKETPLYDHDGYAFALIAEGKDGNIVFSRVEDNSQLQNAVEKGQLTPENWREYLPTVDVLMLKPGSSPILLVGNAEEYTLTGPGANAGDKPN